MDHVQRTPWKHWQESDKPGHRGIRDLWLTLVTPWGSGRIMAQMERNTTFGEINVWFPFGGDGPKQGEAWFRFSGGPARTRLFAELWAELAEIQALYHAQGPDACFPGGAPTLPSPGGP